MIKTVDEIINNLKSCFPENGISIESWPDDPEAYDFIHDVAILVRFNGKDFGIPVSAGKTIQESEHTYIISVLCRSLSLNNSMLGIYETLKRLEDQLLGKKFNGGGKTILKKVNFVGNYESRWHYDVIISFNKPIVEKTEQEKENLIKKITAKGNFL